MMSQNGQLTLFYVLSVVGVGILFLMILFTAFDVVLVVDDIAAELKAQDLQRLGDRAMRLLPGSLLFAGVAIGTFFSYRRHQKLLRSNAA